jgi:selenophosphate synthase
MNVLRTRVTGFGADRFGEMETPVRAAWHRHAATDVSGFGLLDGGVVENAQRSRSYTERQLMRSSVGW